MASNTFIFGSKTSLNGIPVANNGPRKDAPRTITEHLENKRCNGEFQNGRKKNVGLKKSVPNNRIISTPAPRSSSSSNFGGSSVLSQGSSKPWFIATHNDEASLDEMKELNLEMWKDNHTSSNQQIDKDVLY